MKNREIKFRVWSKKRKKYIQDWSFREINEKNNIVLQQFTCLKDKNGKEIYEGDILKWDKGFMYEEMNGKVQWLRNGFYFRNKIVNWTLPSLCKDAEIIGNFFENPELLN